MSAPPSTTERRRRRSNNGSNRPLLIENHYRVDTRQAEGVVVLPGVPRHDDDFQRDCHDFFNLIVLVPVVVLNVLNWDLDALVFGSEHQRKSVPDSWTGEWFDSFWYATLVYFVADAIWVAVVPRCVKSPGVIIKHHVATLLYIFVPKFYPEYQWVMGACMIVEINTWFLIARRIFNKQGFSPWIIKLPPLLSIRVKLISILFYTSWVVIRCILYPVIFRYLAMEQVRLRGTVGPWNVMACVCLPLHTVFCVLNFKWTYDLLMSKMRYWRRGGGRSGGAEEVSKGL